MSPRAKRAASDDTPPAPTPSDVEEYLRHLAKERDVSPNTVIAYRAAGWAGRDGFQQSAKWVYQTA